MALRFVLPCPQGALGTIPCLAAGFGSSCSGRARGAHSQGWWWDKGCDGTAGGGTEVTAMGNDLLGTFSEASLGQGGLVSMPWPWEISLGIIGSLTWKGPTAII